MAFGFGQGPDANGDKPQQYIPPQYGQYQYNQQYNQYANGYDNTQPGGYAYAQPPTMDARMAYSSETYEKATRTSVARAYGEMTIGILVTAVVAILTQGTGLLYSYLAATGTLGWILLVVVQVGVAVTLGARVMRMKPSTARLMFYIYAALMGFTLSSIFATYNLGSIGLALLMTAGFFLCLTMVALTTKLNMLKAGPILMVALIVLIVAELIMMFIVPTSTTTMIFSAIALVIFAGLTMYDAQATRTLFRQYANDETMIRRVSILCALNLYLDFINFFMQLLTIFGSSDN